MHSHPAREVRPRRGGRHEMRPGMSPNPSSTRRLQSLSLRNIPSPPLRVRPSAARPLSPLGNPLPSRPKRSLLPNARYDGEMTTARMAHSSNSRRRHSHTSQLPKLTLPHQDILLRPRPSFIPIPSRLSKRSTPPTRVLPSKSSSLLSSLASLTGSRLASSPSPGAPPPSATVTPPSSSLPLSRSTSPPRHHHRTRRAASQRRLDRST